MTSVSTRWPSSPCSCRCNHGRATLPSHRVSATAARQIQTSTHDRNVSKRYAQPSTKIYAWITATREVAVIQASLLCAAEQCRLLESTRQQQQPGLEDNPVLHCMPDAQGRLGPPCTEPMLMQVSARSHVQHCCPAAPAVWHVLGCIHAICCSMCHNENQQAAAKGTAIVTAAASTMSSLGGQMLLLLALQQPSAGYGGHLLLLLLALQQPTAAYGG